MRTSGGSIIDVSLTIGPGLLVWPGDPPASVEPRSQIAKGDAANVSEVRMGTHTGTHVDPPNHFIEGASGIDEVPLDALIGPAYVADLHEIGEPIEPDILDALPLPEGTERLLLRTANSELWDREAPEFPERYACLTPDAARWVVEHGLRLVGVDMLSVEQKGAQGHPVHHTLLGNGVVIVEGLDLRRAAPGRMSTLMCLPLRIAGGDGGPARAVLIED